MKSKVLSFILALTLLCSILMVPTVSFAAADKGDEIVIDGSADFVLSGASAVYSGNVTKDYDGRNQLHPIIQVENTDKGAGSLDGSYPHFEKTLTLDLTQPFTIQFDYFARGGTVNVALSLGNADLFICMNGSGAVFQTKGGTELTKLDGITLAPTKWHTVAFTYDGTVYSVYADGTQVGDTFTSFRSDHTDADKLKIGVCSASKKDTSISDTTILAVDELYAYQSAYEPEEPEEPEVEKDVITITPANPTVTASATFSEDRIGDTFYLAVYNRIENTDYLQLIGVDKVVIDEAGFKQLNLSFPDKWGFVHRVKAFVWEDDCTPTDIYDEIIGY